MTRLASNWASTRTATLPKPRRRPSDESFPATAAAMYAVGKERGWSKMTRAQYDASSSLRGAYFVGDPEQVAEKILYQHEIFNHNRFLLQMSVGTLAARPDHEINRAVRHAGRAAGSGGSGQAGRAGARFSLVAAELALSASAGGCAAAC